MSPHFFDVIAVAQSGSSEKSECLPPVRILSRESPQVSATETEAGEGTQKTDCLKDLKDIYLTCE